MESSVASGRWSEGRLNGAVFGVFGFFPRDNDLKNPFRELVDSVDSEVVDWPMIALGE